MSKPPVESPVLVGVSNGDLAPVLLLFLGSGCASLIYEVVWFQQLSLVIGSSAVSMAVLLGTFMGGMCVGSLGFARFVYTTKHPLVLYALLELGIATLSVLVVTLLPYAGGLYIVIGGRGAVGLAIRASLCSLCLFPPTILMGATFPAVARWVPGTARGASWLGAFYAANTVGAVLGCGLSGYYLLRLYDATTATRFAVSINVAVALAGWSLWRLKRARAWRSEGGAQASAAPPGSWVVYITIALSGMTALAAEVVWTRFLSLLLGGTVYAFSLILAVFLLGLGVGSTAGSAAAQWVMKPRVALGTCQALLIVGILWGAYWLMRALPYWPLNPTLPTPFIYQFQVDIVRCLLAIFPAACLWGASFPLALASLASGNERADLGRVTGLVYTTNTAGSIVGAVAASLMLIPRLGTRATQQLLVVVSAISAAFVLIPSASETPGRKRIALAVCGVGAAGWLALWVPEVPAPLVGWGQNVAGWWKYYRDIIYVGEGMNSSVAVSRIGQELNYHAAGKIQASTLPTDMRLQRMLGHLATLVPDRPNNVLVIGCGAGITAGAVSIDPAVKRETIVELESLVPLEVTSRFSAANFDVVSNPKVHIEIDDARHFVLATDETFDAVTSDPFDPWVKGAATLYTKEFFELINRHLNPGGVVTIFVQLYESTEDAVKSELVTFLDVFPGGAIFGNTENGKGYDVVLLGRAGHSKIDVDSMEQRLNLNEYAPIRKSLNEVGFHSTLDLLSTFAVAGPDLREWLAAAQLNSDRNLRLQYLAGLGLNVHDHVAIYSHMTQSRRYPDGLFVGTAEQLSSLRAAMRLP